MASMTRDGGRARAATGGSGKADSGRTGDATASNSELGELAGHSRTVFAWTLVSRLTGFLRVALLAAVLGPTFFGNLVQTALFLPYVVCQLLLASLIPAILTPHLVRLIEAGERREARELACRCMGLILALFGAVAVLTILAAPLILPLLTLAVEDAAVRAQQQTLGWYLLLFLAPQVPLYGIAMLGVAVQQAHRRFAIATAAPAFENLVFVGILIATALLFESGNDVEAVHMGKVACLGLGSTLAVAAYALAQWWGAKRAGMLLLPKTGWRDEGLREVLKLALPSSGNTILLSIGMLAMLIVAGGIPGGSVAFQVAYNLFNLPTALCARPIAAAQLPLLARSHAAGGAGSSLFREALRLTLFIALPAILVFLILPDQLATLVTFGGMRSEAGLALVAAAIAGLGLGILGESVMIVATSAAYARHDAVSPFRAMATQTLLLLAGLAPVALLLDGPLRLTAIGLVFSTASITGAIYLYRRQIAGVAARLDPSLLRDLACAGLAVGGGLAVTALLSDGTAALGLGGVGQSLAALATAGLVYLASQLLCRSSQLAMLLATIWPGAAMRLARPGGGC